MHQSNENLHAERAAIATILQNPEFLMQLPEKLDLDAFKNPANRAIARLALDLYNSGFERFDRELLQNKIALIEVPGIQVHEMQNYVAALLSADIESINFTNYLDELREAHLKDSLSKLLHSSISDLSQRGSASGLLGSLQTKLYEMDAGINKNDDPVDIAQGFGKTLLNLVEHPQIGIPTGIDLLDDLTLGWLKKKFYFIGARPGEGKSAFLLQAAAHAAFFAKERRVPVLYLDTEIDEDEFRIRLAGHLAGVDTKIIQQGLWTRDPETKANVERAIKFVEAAGGIYHKEMPGYSLANVVNTIRKYVYNYGVGLVIFDYIEEPSDGEDSERWQKVGKVARTLKNYAQILEIPVVAALQQNKKGDEKSRVSSSAFGESDDVFKKADGAFALNRKTAAEIDKETIQAGTHRLQILKGRYHATSYNGLNLRYVGYCLRFWPAQIQATDQQENHDHDGDNANEHAQLPVATENLTAPLVP